MSDDLDNFFSKTDKKKGKKKTKIVAGDLLEQKKDEEARRLKRELNKNKPSKDQLSSDLRKSKEDDDWEDFEDQELNLANIRITNLTNIKSVPAVDPTVEESDGDKNSNGEDEDSDNESSQHGNPDHKETVWGTKVAATAAPPPVVEAVETKEEPAPEEPDVPKAPAKYQPPGRRGQTGTGGPGGEPLKPMSIRNRKVNAPDISNAEEFPTLGSAPPAQEDMCSADGQLWTTQHRTPREPKVVPTPQPVASSNESNALPSTPGRYVPPGKRQSAAGGSQSNGPPRQLFTTQNRFAKLDDD